MPGDKDKAEVGELIAKALKAYSDALGAEALLAPELFLKKLGFTDDDIDKNKDLIEGAMGEFNEPEKPDEVIPEEEAV